MNGGDLTPPVPVTSTTLSPACRLSFLGLALSLRCLSLQWQKLRLQRHWSWPRANCRIRCLRWSASSHSGWHWRSQALPARIRPPSQPRFFI